MKIKKQLTEAPGEDQVVGEIWLDDGNHSERFGYVAARIRGPVFVLAKQEMQYEILVAELRSALAWLGTEVGGSLRKRSDRRRAIGDPMVETAPVWRHFVFRALSELADPDYQQRAWLASEGEEFSSLVEAACGLFDDSLLGDALESGRVVFTPELDAGLVELGRLLDAVDGSTYPGLLLEDPKFAEVRSKARSLLFSLIRHETRGDDATDGTSFPR